VSIDDWFKWPTNSSDPGVNFVVLVAVIVFVTAAVTVGVAIAIPVLIVLAIAKGAHWYASRPIPTDDLRTEAQQRVIAASFPTREAFHDMHLGRLIDAIRDDPPALPIVTAMVGISDDLYRVEDLNNPLPPIAPQGTIEEGRYRDALIAYQRKSADAPKTLETINATLGAAYTRFIAGLPPIAKTTLAEFVEDGPPPFATFPLIDVLPNPANAVMTLISPFFSDAPSELGLFAGLRRQLESNTHEVSGVAYPAPGDKLIFPEDFKGLPRDLVFGYLHDTPLEELFAAPIPFAFTDEQRFEHMHIIGGSGHGKTQLLQHMILRDLTRPNPPALVVIDSQGEMLRKIRELRLFAGDMADRLVIIDPELYSPALNMFDITNARTAHYSALHREQIQAGIIELYNYIFASIAAEMTSRQSTAFAFVARLMLTVPGATMHTLRELMEDPAQTIEQSPFARYIAQLDNTSRAYFQNQFFTRKYTDLRQQIARRLYGVLSVPAFDRMFSAPENKLDMFEAMQSGKVVLVNTSKSLLKSDASALFGRYMIALVIRAVYERVATADRHPAFLIVDEASEYFDDNIQMLLEQARKFGVGLVLAHQHLDQLSMGLRSAISANSSIKLAGGVNDRDARLLAPDMRTSAEFITSMRKSARSTQFACYVRNYTTNALQLEIPFGSLESSERMSRSEQTTLLAENERRYAVGRGEPRQAAADRDTSRPAATEPDAMPTDDWRS
jgi:hypothetical protein